MAFNLVFKTTDCTVGMAKPLPTWINLYYIRYVNYFSAAVLLICGVGIGVSYIETVLLLPSSSFFFFFVFLDCITLSNLIQLHLYSSFHSLAIFLHFFCNRDGRQLPISLLKFINLNTSLNVISVIRKKVDCNT